MPKIPGIHHLQAIRALRKAGFAVVREGKHTVMSDGARILTIPRHNPINAFTMGGIAKDAGMTPEQFRELLWEPHRTIRASQGREAVSLRYERHRPGLAALHVRSRTPSHATGAEGRLPP